MTAVRRTRVAAAVGALSVIGAGALVLPALGAPATPCGVAFTDPAGDVVVDLRPAPSPPKADGDIDLTSVGFGTKGDDFQAVVTMAALGTGSQGSDGDYVHVTFTANSKVVELESWRAAPVPNPGDPTPIGLLPPTSAQWSVGGATQSKPVKATYDTTASTVTFAVKTADLAAATGAAVQGSTLSKLSAEAGSNYQLVWNLAYDSADGGAKTAKVSECAGGATPTESGTPSETGSATAEPTEEPTEQPSETPTDTPTSPTPTELEEPTAFAGYDVPKDKCLDTTDPASDSQGKLLGQLPVPGSEAETDITGFATHTTADTIGFYISTPGLSASGPSEPYAAGDAFSWKFTVGGKAVVVAASRTGGTAGAPTATVAGADKKADLKPTVKFDAAKHFVVFTVDKAGLAAAAATAVTKGTELSAISATSTWNDKLMGSTASDEAKAAKPEDAVYAVGGKDACFFPEAGTLTLGKKSITQYGDGASVKATLTDAAAAPVEGAVVVFTLGSGKALGMTDASGVATAKVPALAKAGTSTMKATWVGDDKVGAATVSSPWSIKAEKTSIVATTAKSGSSKQITAVLFDDDTTKHAIGGEPLVFTVAGKKQTVKTSSKGTAVLKGVKSGVTVSVAYAGKKGYYLSSSTAVKA